MRIEHFEDLRVWQLGHTLAIEIYSITKLLPDHELYGLTNQLRRSAASVPANIVEGFYRDTTKELIKFLYNARGSAGEVTYFLILSRDIGYISDELYRKIRKNYEELLRLISALIKSLKAKNEK